MRGQKNRSGDFGTPKDNEDGHRTFKKRNIPGISEEIEKAEELEPLQSSRDRGGCSCW